jgi:rod shape determining protein RodA
MINKDTMRKGNIFSNLDWFTVFIYLLLVLMGWLNIYSAVYSEKNPGIFDFTQRYGKQFIWIAAALILAVSVILIDHRFYEYFAYPIYGFTIIVLLGVLLFGKEVNGAKSWFSLGSFQLQPSEFAKPAAALALARYLSGFNINVKSFSSLAKSAVIIGLPIILILLQPDTGSALVYFAFVLALYREGFPSALLLTLFSMAVLFILVLLVKNYLILFVVLFIGAASWGIVNRNVTAFFKVLGVYLGYFGLVYLLARISGFTSDLYYIGLMALVPSFITFLILKYILRVRKGLITLGAILSAIIFSGAVDVGYHKVLSDYQQRRISIMLGLESDPKGAGYNVNQSKIAIGSGGFSGKGYLKGTQTKLNFVPEQSTDFIFCTVGEEWGFLGSVVVIGLFTVLLLRLVHLAERQRNRFARIYGYGVISIFFFHFLVNIAMTIGLFPVIGIPLPFFSYGGSSLWAFTALLFIFLKRDAARTEYVQ